jgi:hypothetical protein
MNKLVFLLALLTVIVSPAFAQEEPPLTETMSIGPYIALKAGVNGSNVQEGRKNGISFNGIPDVGLSLYYPLGTTSTLGLHGDLGYSLYTFYIKDAGNNKEYLNKYSYITFAPNFRFGYFSIGFNFGVPLSGKVEEDVRTEDMNYLAEFRITGTYPILQDEDGTMNVFFTGGYMFTGVFKDYAKSDPHKNLIPIVSPDNTTNKFNLRAISASLGINYMFNIRSTASVEEE